MAAEASTTSGVAASSLLTRAGTGASVGTFGVLLLVGGLARDAFEAQLEATENAVDAIEDVRVVVADTQDEVAGLKKKLDAVETTEQRERGDLEVRLRRELEGLRAELAELRECVEHGKRCKR